MPVVVSTEELYEEQRKDEELKAPIERETALSLKKLRLDNGDKTIYYDVSDQIRIYVPATLRKRIVNTTHNLSHSSARATKKMIAQFVWPNMQKDINKWVKTCLPCQRSKIHRYNVRIPEHIQVPGDCFHHVYMDIVGPLLASVGYHYCLTMIDRTTEMARGSANSRHNSRYNRNYVFQHVGNSFWNTSGPYNRQRRPIRSTNFWSGSQVNRKPTHQNNGIPPAIQRNYWTMAQIAESCDKMS